MPTIAQAAITDALNKITNYTHDRRASARLLYNLRSANRDKSLAWCVDVVIQQLVRDRGR